MAANAKILHTVMRRSLFLSVLTTALLGATQVAQAQ
jgi:hypothetical protein